MTTQLNAPASTIDLTDAQTARLASGLPVRLPVTEGAFLAFWPTTRYRAEYHNDQLIIMGLAAFIHEVMVMNLGILLARFYKPENGFFVAGSNVGLQVPLRKNYYSPDITVVQGNPAFAGTPRSILTNPHLLVEVLSESTEAYDLNAKLLRYKQIASLQAVLYVDYFDKVIIVAHRTDTPKVWTLTTYDEPDELVRFKTHAVPLGDFFANR